MHSVWPPIERGACLAFLFIGAGLARAAPTKRPNIVGSLRGLTGQVGNQKGRRDRRLWREVAFVVAHLWRAGPSVSGGQRGGVRPVPADVSGSAAAPAIACSMNAPAPSALSADLRAQKPDDEGPLCSNSDRAPHQQWPTSCQLWRLRVRATVHQH